jgi:predicted Fe-S protein YdhL (DUF1289 family)
MSSIPSSPCVKKCQLVGEMCSGCGRTITEIANWTRLTPDEQHKVADESGRRLISLAPREETLRSAS